MARKCEMCAALAACSSVKAIKPRRILIEDRVFALCEAHAEQVRAQAPGSIAALRRLFSEPSGRRSLVSRRAPLDRRIFPARPEGRRAAPGRRAGDAVE